MSTNNDLSSNRIIYDAIRKIASHRYINKNTGTFRNTERKTGYVAKIHTDESDELCGTIDVQEFNITQLSDDGLDGYHEGVLLSAIQNNKNGMMTIPMLYSEVVIAADPVTLQEYVVQYSHVDNIQMDSHQGVTVGVTETEAYDTSDENTPNFDELAKTGVHAHTTYTKNSISSMAVGKSKQSSQSITDEKIEQTHDKATNTLDDNQNMQKFNDSSVSEKSGKVIVDSKKVFLGEDNASQSAVLGEQLADFLMTFLNTLAQVKTTTQLGPQPFINLAQFISLKSQVNSFKQSCSGFLSKTVKVKDNNNG